MTKSNDYHLAYLENMWEPEMTCNEVDCYRFNNSKYEEEMAELKKELQDEKRLYS